MKIISFHKKIPALLLVVILSLAMLWGCAGDSTKGPTASPPPSATPEVFEQPPAPTENPAPKPIDEVVATPPPGEPSPTPAPELKWDYADLADMPHREEYLSLKASNPEVLAWVTVPNTKMDYAAALTKDNEKYLHTTLTGEESKAGAIFFDYRTDASLSGRHLILYGHNMKAGTMFHDLNSYKHKQFFENNRIITLWAGSEHREYEVYAAYIATEDTYFIRMAYRDDDHFLNYMTDLQALSKFPADVQLEGTDQILTLVTCTYEEDNARFVVQARRIK